MEEFKVEELEDLLKLGIPTSPKNEIGFLELTGQQYKEVINSRVYAYFLNPSNDSRIANLFLNALLDLIAEKAPQKERLSFRDFTCDIEVVTHSGEGRIDILIVDQGCGSAIIIENKLYHHLNNDLDGYRKHIPQEYKGQGVLLTLGKENPKTLEDHNHNFINITHIEWINKIKEKGLPANLGLKQYVYLNDFLTTIQQISNHQKMDIKNKFFFSNISKIAKAHKLYDDVYNNILDQINVAANQLNLSVYGEDKNNSGKFWRSIWNEKIDSKAYYTICFDKLFSEEDVSKEIILCIELFQKETIEKIGELDILLAGCKEMQNLERGTKGVPSDDKLHYLYKEYTIKQENFNSFSDFICNAIDKDFSPIMDIIEKQLERDKLNII